MLIQQFKPVVYRDNLFGLQWIKISLFGNHITFLFERKDNTQKSQNNTS